MDLVEELNQWYKSCNKIPQFNDSTYGGSKGLHPTPFLVECCYFKGYFGGTFAVFNTPSPTFLGRNGYIVKGNRNDRFLIFQIPAYSNYGANWWIGVSVNPKDHICGNFHRGLRSSFIRPFLYPSTLSPQTKFVRGGGGV